MPVYDRGGEDCGECQREFGPDRSAAIANYEARDRYYASLSRKHNEDCELRGSGPCYCDQGKKL